MKITKLQLKQIIKEELESLLDQGIKSDYQIDEGIKDIAKGLGISALAVGALCGVSIGAGGCKVEDGVLMTTDGLHLTGPSSALGGWQSTQGVKPHRKLPAWEIEKSLEHIKKNRAKIEASLLQTNDPATTRELSGQLRYLKKYQTNILQHGTKYAPGEPEPEKSWFTGRRKGSWNPETGRYDKIPTNEITKMEITKMKITKAELKQIIKEELEAALAEGGKYSEETWKKAEEACAAEGLADDLACLQAMLDRV